MLLIIIICLARIKYGSGETAEEIIGSTYYYNKWTVFVGTKLPKDFNDASGDFTGNESAEPYITLNNLISRNIQVAYCRKMINNLHAGLEFIVIEQELLDLLPMFKENRLYEYIEGKKYEKKNSYICVYRKFPIVISSDPNEIPFSSFLPIEKTTTRRIEIGIDEGTEANRFYSDMFYRYVNMRISRFRTDENGMKIIKKSNHWKPLYYAEENDIRLFGVVFAGISKRFLVFGDAHNTWENVFHEKCAPDLDMYFYLKQLGAHAKMHDYNVNLYIEGNADVIVEHIKQTYCKTFVYGENPHLPFKYIDCVAAPYSIIRTVINLLLYPIERINLNMLDIRKSFGRSEKNLFNTYKKGILLSDNLFDECQITDEKIQEQIKNAFSNDFMAMNGSYKKHIAENKYMTRTAYEFYRFKRDDPKLYGTVIGCIEKIITNKNRTIDGELTLYTDLYVLARALRRPKAYNIFYAGANHATNYANIIKYCGGIGDFKFYTGAKPVKEFILKAPKPLPVTFIKFETQSELFFGKTDEKKAGILDFTSHSTCNVL